MSLFNFIHCNKIAEENIYLTEKLLMQIGMSIWGGQKVMDLLTDPSLKDLDMSDKDKQALLAAANDNKNDSMALILELIDKGIIVAKNE